jgi:type II secretory pathway component PulF
MAKLKVKNAATVGFGATLGSYGATALFGIIMLLGVLLYRSAEPDPAQNREENMALKIAGIGLIVVGSIPVLPLLGIHMLFHEWD